MKISLMVPLIITLFFLIVLSAVFSAAETAYSSVSPSKIEKDFRAGKRNAKLIKKHYKKFGWTLSTILISNNLVNIGASSLITYLFSSLMGATGVAALISTLVMTPILVAFGEITPKLFAKKFPYGYLTRVVYLIEFLNLLFSPLTYPLSKITLSSNITNSENDIKNLLTLAKNERVLQASEATLASKALDLDSSHLSSIMQKRDKIIFANRNIDIRAVKEIFRECGHSRLPIKENHSFVGMIFLKDIIFASDNENLEKYIKPIIKISKNTLLSKALEDLRFNKSHMALISENNNSSRILGLVTIEDIIEELVGEIYDEHDASVSVLELNSHKWVCKGSILAIEVQEFLELDLQIEDEDQTIKEWIQSRINRRIKSGLKYTYNNTHVFKIISNKNIEGTMIEIRKK